MKEICPPCPTVKEVVLVESLPDTLCPCPVPKEKPRLLDIIRKETVITDTYLDALKLVMTTYNCSIEPEKVSYRPPIVDGGPPLAVLGEPYNFRFSVRNGEPPYVFSVTGDLSDFGLVFSPSTGILSGVPIITGRSHFVVRVIDERGRSNSLLRTLDIVA